MTTYAVFGAGLMGKAVARDLAETEPGASVVLYDADEDRLAEAARFVGGDRLATARLDATDRAATVAALREAGVAVGALPHGLSLGLVEAAVEAGARLVDLVGEGPEERLALDEAARRSGASVLVGCGVAPGISNVLVGRGVRLLEQVDNAFVYVGGIPRVARPPLFYETVYLLESVFNAYRREAVILEGGRPVRVPPLSGRETLRFDEPVGALEAFYTDGLASLALTMRERVRGRLFEKTLRWPGHVERIELLRDCGLLDDEPVRVGETAVRPLRLLLRLLGERLRLGPEGDLLVLRVVVEGRAEGGAPTRHVFELVDAFDPKTGYTAMARTTGFAATAAARLLATGALAERGILFPETTLADDLYEPFVRQLAERGVRIVHRVEAG